MNNYLGYNGALISNLSGTVYYLKKFNITLDEGILIASSGVTFCVDRFILQTLYTPLPAHQILPQWIIDIKKKETYEKDVALVPKEDTRPTGCNHIWKKYTGLVEVYDYCGVCDAKR